MILLSEERLQELQTSRGGFLFSTLRALGVEFVGNEPKPWKSRMVDSWISDQRWTDALATVHPAKIGPSLFDPPKN